MFLKTTINTIAIFTFLLFSLIPQKGISQCALACTNTQVSLDEFCQALITPDMILEGYDSTCVGPLIVEIQDLNGNIIPTSPVVNVAYLNQYVIGQVTDSLTGNSCWDSIYVEDKLAPIILCPSDTLIYSMEAPTPTRTGEATASDGCFPPTLTYSDISMLYTNPLSDTLTTITRTWYAEDPSGNIDSCQQIIYLKIPNLMMVEFPPHLDNNQLAALSCGSEDTSPAYCGEPHILNYPINEIDGFSSSYIDNNVNLCDGSYAVYREWKVIDLGAVTDIEHDQVIHVDDTNPPSLTCPADMTISTSVTSCKATVIIPNPVTSDACASTDSISVALQVSGGQISGNTIYDLEAGIYSATCVATDACGNQSTCEFIITVEDSQPPVAVSNSNPNITLVPNGATYVHASTFDDGSWDNCGNISLKVRRTDLPTCDTIGNEFDDFVPFFCCDVGSNVMIELRVEDDLGNQSFAMSAASIFDNTPPGILCAPEVTIDCFADPTDLSLTGEPNVTDNCSGFNYEYLDNNDINTCGEGTITRTWTVTDANGQISNCTQLIHLENPNTFYINPTDPLDPDDDIVWPLDYTTYSCGANLHPDSLPSPYSFPTITVDTCGHIGIGHTDTDVTNTPNACKTILRKWVIVDWCNFNPLTFEGQWEYAQIITIVNSDAPEFSNTCNALTFSSNDVDCENADAFIEVAATDDCTPTADLVFSYEIDLFKNGNTDMMGDEKFIEEELPLGNHQIVFTVLDACGQTNTCSFDVEIIDGLSPTPVCYVSLAVDLNGLEVSISAAEMNEGSNDNCSASGDLIYSFSSDTSRTDSVFNCSHIGFNALQLWVTDEAGNQSFCSGFINLQDNLGICNPLSTAEITGAIKNEDDEPIEQVILHLNNANIPPIITDVNGEFSFSQIPTGQDYEVEPQKTENPNNGLTTFDLVLISRHILGIEFLNSPYKIIAADANLSKTITTFDIVLLRRLILQLDDHFDDGNSWRFVDQSFVFPDPANPFATDFPEMIDLIDFDGNVDLDFIAIKKGDVNGSALLNFTNANNTDTRTNNLSLFYKNQKLSPDQKTTISFYAANFEFLDGLQFSLSFDDKKFNIEKIESSILSNFKEGNYFIKNNTVTVSWNHFESLSFDYNQPLFSLELDTKTTGDLLNAFQIKPNPIQAEVYQNNEIAGLDLTVKEDLNTSFFLGQNIPNPFQKNTVIPFELPAASEITFTIFDLNGKIVFRKSNVLKKGSHQIEINTKNLNGKGIYYYQLKTNSATTTRKMLLMK